MTVRHPPGKIEHDKHDMVVQEGGVHLNSMAFSICMAFFVAIYHFHHCYHLILPVLAAEAQVLAIAGSTFSFFKQQLLCGSTSENILNTCF